MTPNPKITAKLEALPDKPGVYFMRDRAGRVIYVGKAASLRNRVRHYFQPATARKADPKLRSLIHSIADLDVLPLRTEEEAALTEGRLIKEYRPRYNISFKDDKRFLLLRVSTHEPWPRFTKCRIAKDDGAEYFGPYTSSYAAGITLEFMERRFGLRSCRPREPGPADYKHCHNDIIRFCSAPCIGRVSAEAYRQRVDEACAFLRGERPAVLQELAETMKAEAEQRNFEKAAAIRDTLGMIRHTLRRRLAARRSPELDAQVARQGLEEIRQALGLPGNPHVIECYDISNISGTHAVGSMVCAIDGRPSRTRYRHFRIQSVEGSDDPRSMAEVIRRRYGRVLKEGTPMPDLVIVDGGITQLRAARRELDVLGLHALPAAGLAKQFEELVTDENGKPGAVRLQDPSSGLHVLQQLRDEAHRFALTYHRKLRNQRIRESQLDDIQGIGEKKKRLILSHFGSVSRLRRATLDELQKAPGIGPHTAELLQAHFHPRDDA